jgi:hypothetical protein
MTLPTSSQKVEGGLRTKGRGRSHYHGDEGRAAAHRQIGCRLRDHVAAWLSGTLVYLHPHGLDLGV